MRLKHKYVPYKRIEGRDLTQSEERQQQDSGTEYVQRLTFKVEVLKRYWNKEQEFAS